jgi:hypothetical protein
VYFSTRRAARCRFEAVKSWLAIFGSNMSSIRIFSRAHPALTGGGRAPKPSARIPGPVRVLTREDLATSKGIVFSRQHIDRMVRAGTFPSPFQIANPPQPQSSKASPQRVPIKKDESSEHP